MIAIAPLHKKIAICRLELVKEVGFFAGAEPPPFCGGHAPVHALVGIYKVCERDLAE